MRSVGRSEQVVKLILANPDLLADVVQAILSEDPGIRMRASDAVEKISREQPGWLKPYKKCFLNKIVKIEQKEVRWHIAQILPRFSLTSKERDKMFNLMRSYLNDNSQIVKTFALQALTDFALQDHTYVPRVKSIVSLAVDNGAPSQQSRGRKLLKTLSKLEK